jgi:hypothetical protein
MARNCECPKCGADISDSWQEAEHDVGISAGWFCDACDHGVADDGGYEPIEGDVGLMTAKEFRGDRPLGTPISELRGRPEFPGDPRYEEFKRIAKSYGYD